MKIPDHLTVMYCKVCKINTNHRDLWSKRCNNKSDVASQSWKIYHAIECIHCNEICFLIRTWIHPGSMLGDAHINKEEFFPILPYHIQPVWFAELAEKLKHLLFEVYSAADMSLYTIATMGIRAVIDMVLTDHVGDVGGFEKKLNMAIEKGLIEENLREPISAVIDVGHASSHRGHLLEKNSFLSLLTIMEHLLHKIYVTPKEEKSLLVKAQNLRSSTPKRK